MTGNAPGPGRAGPALPGARRAALRRRRARLRRDRRAPAADETSPYGMRGNAIVRYSGETYDNIVLVGGFSKAYSSLLAFLALPTWLKNHLKVAAPPYLYSGPSPTASLATVLAGFDVNAERGRRAPRRPVPHDRPGARPRPRARRRTPRTPTARRSSSCRWPPGRDLTAVGRLLWDAGIYVTLAPYPLVPRDQVGSGSRSPRPTPTTRSTSSTPC